MAREIAYFETTETKCLCGETAFPSDMYRTDVLCSHRLAVLGAGQEAQPHPPEVFLQVSSMTWETCEIDFVRDDRVPYCPRDPEIQREIDRITKKIVKEVHGHRKRDEIEAWVAQNERTSNEFCLGETTAFWWMVEMGIEAFRARR
jgi:hypothetical protein